MYFFATDKYLKKPTKRDKTLRFNLICSPVQVDAPTFTMNSHSENRVPLWIDNEPVHTNVEFLVTNSATGKSISASAALPEHVDRVVKSSYRAFAQWSRTTIWQRRDLLLKAAKLLEERRREIESILKVRRSTIIFKFVNNRV